MSKEVDIDRRDQVRVTAVIPAHNRRETTLQCLRSLSRLRLGGIEFRVVVVDDGSSDGTGDAVEREFPDVVLERGDGNLWYAEGTNVGIRRAIGLGTDFVWQMNDDQVVDERSLLLLVEAAVKHPRAVVGSLLLLWDTPHRAFQIAPQWSTFGGGWRHWRHQTVWTVPMECFEVQLLAGNSLLVPVEAYAEAGLLDSERFHLYGDAEFSARLKRKGYRLLLEPRSRVFCEPNSPPASIRKMSWSDRIVQLFGDGRKRHSLRARLGTLAATAPNPILGYVAFFFFLLRAAVGRSYESAWADSRREPELRSVVRILGRP
jgi:GT2 family glycosyltransferase